MLLRHLRRAEIDVKRVGRRDWVFELREVSSDPMDLRAAEPGQMKASSARIAEQGISRYVSGIARHLWVDK